MKIHKDLLNIRLKEFIMAKIQALRINLIRMEVDEKLHVNNYSPY